MTVGGRILPFPSNYFDLIRATRSSSTQDDRLAVDRARSNRAPPGFVRPNRCYPFETHGVYWRGRYRFGNIPLVNWCPIRCETAQPPHVRL